MRPVAVLVFVSVAVGVLTVVPAGLVEGPGHWACGAVAFGLSVPAAAATLALTRWLAPRYRLGVLIGITVGPVVRAVVVLGAAAGVFLAARASGESDLAHPLKFWLWVLFAYLVTLAVETALLIRTAADTRLTGGR
jgi:hypothetical protein